MLQTLPAPNLTPLDEFRAQLKAEYSDWKNGVFNTYVLHPQKIATLRQATDAQLQARRKYIRNLRGAYRTEALNIDRVIRERAACA